MAASTAWKADRGSRFYRNAGRLALFVIAVGFFTTYSRPMLTGSYAGPWWGHVHGALSLAWVFLFTLQAALIPRIPQAHRKLGLAALAIIPLWVASTVFIWREQALAASAVGNEDSAILNTPGALLSPVMILMLVALGLRARRNPQAHKRWMFLATVLMLWPAWSRWRHYFADPGSVFNLFSFTIALAPIPIAMARDLWRFKQVHPVLLYGGSAVILEQLAEIRLYGSPGWNALGRHLFVLLG